MNTKTLTVRDVYGLEGRESCLMWLFLLFPGGQTVAFLRSMLRSVLEDKSLTAERTEGLCSRLVNRGYLTVVSAVVMAEAREYKACVRYDAEALATLRDRAVARNWLPHDAWIEEAFRIGRSYGSSSVRDRYAFPRTAEQRLRTIEALMGCRGPESDAVSVTADGAFDGACFLTGVLDDRVSLLSGVLKGNGDVRLVPAALSAFFFAGREVGGLLDYLREAAVAHDERYPAMAVLSYGALRVWRGEKEELEGIEGWMVPEDAMRMVGIENALRCVSAGECKAAAITLSAVVGSRALSGGNPILFPFLALAFAVCQIAGVPDAKLRRIVSLMRKSLPTASTDDSWTRDGLREKVIAWAQARVKPYESFVEHRGLTDGGTASRAATLPPSFGAIPLVFALRMPACESSGQMGDVGEHLLRWANKALSSQYPVLAGLLLSGCSRLDVWTGAECSRLRALFDTSGAPWLLSPYVREEAWKGVVAELARIVGNDDAPTPKVAREKKGRIVWGLMFSEVIFDDEDSELCEKPHAVTCIELAPYYRGPHASEDASDDRRMTPNGVRGKAYQHLLTDQDRHVLDEMVRVRYNTLRDRKVPMSILEELVDHPFTIEAFPSNYFCEEIERGPRVMTLTRLAWQIKSAQTPNGGLELRLPVCLTKAVSEPCLIRFGVHDFRYLRLSDRERTFVSGFFALSPDGVVTLPPQALQAASPVLTAMAKLAPMEGHFAALADTSGLERIPGEAIPTARLSFRDDVLSVALCVKPYGKNAALVVKPGIGAPERMVRDGRTTHVLVRDLSAESAAAEKVAKSLSEYDGWSGDEPYSWSVGDLSDSLGVLATLKDLGEDVRMEWHDGSRLEVLTRITSKGGLASKGGADRWFRVDGQFEIDEETTLSLLELLRAFRGRIGRFVPLGDKGYLRVSAALARRLEALEAAGRERNGEVAVAAAALPMLGKAFSGRDGDIALPQAMAVEADRVRKAFAARHRIPERLKATLRPYQEDGYVWLARLADCGFGACLADDMGLGKTVQLIALLLARAKDGASLVVAPTSVGGNWRREIERFAPTLHCLCAWETSDDVWMKAGAHDVVITSYGMLVSREERFLGRDWNGVVLDEAQAVKNEGTERARTVKKLAARFRIAATGTPIENRLTELWSIFDFLNPGLLGTSTEFIARLTSEGHATPALKHLVKPLILRRIKREVLDDLPEKTEITLSVALDEKERSGYEACRLKALETLASGGQDNRISILAELTRLRRYCCHPSLVMPEMADSAKMETLVELLRDLKGANHRVLVFSQFTDYLALVEARLRAEGFTYQYLDGATSPKERERRVAEFQKGEGDVFLMSLKAGGTGLNLTAANYVVLLDPWWNPAVEDQAADRVHRIGQKQPVTVYRLVAADTVEERVLELHAEKKQLATDVLDGTGSTALTPEALMKLFG